MTSIFQEFVFRNLELLWGPITMGWIISRPMFYTYSESPRHALWHGATLDGHSIWKKWETVVLVCLVFHVFSKELLTSHCKNTESESLDPSIDFFAWFHIVCHRYGLKKVHFTCFNTILPFSPSSPCQTHLLPSADFLSCGPKHVTKDWLVTIQRSTERAKRLCIALRTTERLFSWMCEHMLLEVTSCCAGVVALRTIERLLSRMG